MFDSNIAFLSFNFFNTFLHSNQDINAVELHMYNPFKAHHIILNAAKKINTQLMLYTWISSYQNIYHNIKIIKMTAYLTFCLLIIMSCFSIASISLMTISKNTKVISILCSLGANRAFIQFIFLYYGLRRIVFNSVIALITSSIFVLHSKKFINFVKQQFNFKVPLDNMNYLNFMLLKLNFLDVIIIFISALVLGMITNWYPAYYASKINPYQILKEY